MEVYRRLPDFFDPNRVDFDGSFLHTEMVSFRCFCCIEDGAGIIFEMVVFEQNLGGVNVYCKTGIGKQVIRRTSSSSGFHLI